MSTLYTMVAPCFFGTESTLNFEVKRLGAQNIQVTDGRVAFQGGADVIAAANLNLRTAERVLLLLATYKATTFDELFDGCYNIAWEDLLPANAAFPVKGSSLSSQLSSVPACQSIVKKAIVKRLMHGHKVGTLPEAALTIYDNLEFLLRLLLSAALGALVGLERSKRRKEAGIRTHCIIACTSALFMIVSKYAFLDCLNIDGLRGADPARIAAQVVSGISFLGAGVIFKNGNSIRGLTTAAGMWGTAAIGMAVGAGMYWLGLFESAVLVAIQVILHRFPVGADALTTQEILVEMEDTEDMQRRFDELLKKHGGQVTDSSLTREDGFLRMEITAKLEPPISHEEALAFMKENTGVRRMSV